MFVNDLPNAITNSEPLLFADDTKCFRQIRRPPDQQLLQHDLDNLLSWSTSSNLHFNSSKSCHLSYNPNLHFNSSKSCHLSYNQKTSTSFTISDNIIVTKQSHKDLGVTLSNNLERISHREINIE